MNFLTDDLKQKLLDNGKPENRYKDHPPIVRLFIPLTSCSWLLSELDYEEPDIAFGLCDLGIGFPELGWVSLHELASVKAGGLLPVICDHDFKASFPMSVYAAAARGEQGITLDLRKLQQGADDLNFARKQNGIQPS
jgi:hypothetical protein